MGTEPMELVRRGVVSEADWERWLLDRWRRGTLLGKGGKKSPGAKWRSLAIARAQEEEKGFSSSCADLEGRLAARSQAAGLLLQTFGLGYKSVCAVKIKLTGGSTPRLPREAAETPEAHEWEMHVVVLSGANGAAAAVLELHRVDDMLRLLQLPATAGSVDDDADDELVSAPTWRAELGKGNFCVAATPDKYANRHVVALDIGAAGGGGRCFLRFAHGFQLEAWLELLRGAVTSEPESLSTAVVEGAEKQAGRGADVIAGSGLPPDTGSPSSLLPSHSAGVPSLPASSVVPRSLRQTLAWESGGSGGGMALDCTAAVTTDEAAGSSLGLEWRESPRWWWRSPRAPGGPAQRWHAHDVDVAALLESHYRRRRDDAVTGRDALSAHVRVGICGDEWQVSMDGAATWTQHRCDGEEEAQLIRALWYVQLEPPDWVPYETPQQQDRLETAFVLRCAGFYPPIAELPIHVDGQSGRQLHAVVDLGLPGAMRQLRASSSKRPFAVVRSAGCGAAIPSPLPQGPGGASSVIDDSLALFDARSGPPPFDPLQWAHCFARHHPVDHRYIQRSMRVGVMEGTARACLFGRYVLPSGKVCELPRETLLRAIRGTTAYPSSLVARSDRPQLPTTGGVVRVVQQDCLRCAVGLLDAGLNPVVLNMGNESVPGGGYRSGAAAQEENIFRRTALYLCLDAERSDVLAECNTLQRRRLYPIPEFGVVYSPQVPLLRGEEHEGYPFLDTTSERRLLSFVTTAAYAKPPTLLLHSDEASQLVDMSDLDAGNSKASPPTLWPGTSLPVVFDTDGRSTSVDALCPDIAERTVRKIEVTLDAALHFGHDAVVLSALGCGAFSNPPHHIAALFHHVLNARRGQHGTRYRDCFRTVVFAIIDDENARAHSTGNFLPFSTRLDDERVESVPRTEGVDSSEHMGAVWEVKMGGTWRRYSPEVCTRFENAWRIGLSSLELPLNGQTYTIVLRPDGGDNSMIQRNQVSGRERPLRRGQLAT